MTLRAIGLAAALLLASVAAFGEGEEPGWSYRLAGDLMSPFCPGRSLSDCPSPNAAELRQWIIDQEKAGVPRTAVEEQLFARWGDQLRQAPRADGVGVLAYVIPAVALVAGAAIVFVFLRRQARAAPPRPAPAVGGPGLDDELEREIDRELRA
jgi:cytochrome c-type biogenesis protein CcmH